MNNSEINTILITGINGEVGVSISKKFKALGWKVIGIDITSKAESQIAEDIDEYYSCDVTNRANLVELVKNIEVEKGPITALFTSVQFDSHLDKGFLESLMEEWQEILNQWLKATANACAAVGPYMKKRQHGNIMILTPDFSNLKGDCIMAATAAGTLHGFIKSFGTEAAVDNVTVNGIFANVPFDLPSIAETAAYLAEEGTYISSQLISLRGEE